MPEAATQTILGDMAEAILEGFGGGRGLGNLVVRETKLTLEGLTPTAEEVEAGIKPIPRAGPGTCQGAVKNLIEIAKLRDQQTLGVNGEQSRDEQLALMLHLAIERIAHDPDVRAKVAMAVHERNPEAIGQMVEAAESMKLIEHADSN